MIHEQFMTQNLNQVKQEAPRSFMGRRAMGEGEGGGGGGRGKSGLS